jgi:hypothetical protein
MNVIRSLIARITAHYDKVLTVLAIAVLAGSLIMITISLGGLTKSQTAFETFVKELKPTHPDAVEVDVDPYEHAVEVMDDRPQVATWSNSMFVPETRCYCIECKIPIVLSTTVCPFCGEKQPIIKERPDDLDSDGMPNEWEEEYAFDPRDPDDADEDADQDLWSNLEEYEAGTNPRDANDVPACATRIEVLKVGAIPFKLLFKAVTEEPDLTLTFQINTRAGGRTYFIKMGEKVEDFTLIDYKEKFETKKFGGSDMRVDVSTITLKSGNKNIELTKDKVRKYDELRARLWSRKDDTKVVVKEGGVYSFCTQEYEVKSIDINEGTVLLQRLSDSEEFTIGGQP